MGKNQSDIMAALKAKADALKREAETVVPITVEDVPAVVHELEKREAVVTAEMAELIGIEVGKEHAAEFAGLVDAYDRTAATIAAGKAFADTLVKVNKDLPGRRKKKIQVSFCIDATGTMGNVMAAVKDSIFTIVRSMEAATSLDIEVGYVAYRDYDDGALRHSVVQFTTPARFKEMLAAEEATGGGDMPEDCFGGLNKVCADMAWNAKDIHVCIWTGDAPGHGFCAPGVSDDFPDGDPDGLTVAKINNALQQKQITLGFLKINNSTDKMLEEMERDYTMRGGAHILQRSYTDSSTIAATIKELLVYSSSVSVTKTAHSGGSMVKRDVPAETLGSVPWDKWDARIPCVRYSRGATVVDTALWNELLAARTPSELRLVQDESELFVAMPYFAAGGVRFAHRGGTARGTKVVVKDFQAHEDSLQMHIDEYRGLLIATLIAHLFCTELRIPTETLSYVAAEIWVAKSRAHVVGCLSQHYSVEAFVEGEFVKFNNNNGFVAKEFELVQAFSHYSWCKTKAALMVLDVQGWVRPAKQYGPTYLLTDPAVQTTDMAMLLTPTNFGEQAMKDFFKVHECNQFCKKLSLPAFAK